MPEKEAVNGIGQATVYLWIVPAKVTGRWRLRVAEPAAQYDLTLKQNYQNFEGADAKGVKLTVTQLRGEDITFTIPAAGSHHLFKGRVSGDTMAGSVELAGGKGAAKWTATRAASPRP